MEMVVHDDSRHQIEMAAIMPPDRLKDRVLFCLSQWNLITVQAPRHKVRRPLHPPVQQAVTVDAERPAEASPGIVDGRDSGERDMVPETAGTAVR
jgi:hypothetical protein